MAAHPAWRSCFVDVAIGVFWDFDATPEEVMAVRQNVTNQAKKLRDLTPGPAYAQYLNEVRIFTRRCAFLTEYSR